MSTLEKLYKEKIKEEASNPHHFNEDSKAEFKERAYNPICGDKFEISFNHSKGILSEVSFHGFGCMISKASTSIMVKLLEQLTEEEAYSMIEEFLKNFRSGSVHTHKELEVFTDAKDFRGREECVELSWSAMEAFLKKRLTDDG